MWTGFGRLYNTKLPTLAFPLVSSSLRPTIFYFINVLTEGLSETGKNKPCGVKRGRQVKVIRKKCETQAIGHIAYYDTTLLKTIITGKTRRGRPPFNYMNQIIQHMSCDTYVQLKRKAERRHWRDCCQLTLGLKQPKNYQK